MLEFLKNYWEIIAAVIGFFTLDKLYNLMTFKRKVKRDNIAYLKEQFDTAVSQFEKLKTLFQDQISALQTEVAELKENICYREKCDTRQR